MVNMSNAVLPAEDRKTFFRLFIPLLDFTNQMYEVSEKLDEQLRIGRPDLCELKMVAEVLWKHTETIGEYIKVCKEQNKITAEDIGILKSWRHPVSGQFILVRHLSKGSVFIDKTAKVYLVKGLTDPWSETLKRFSPPILLDATLIPFRDCIISDGLVTVGSIAFGPGARSDFKECYLNAKQAGRIITSFR